MSYQRITLDPLEAVTVRQPGDGLPLRSVRLLTPDDPNTKYVPIEPRPAEGDGYDPETHKPVRKLTEDAVTWEFVELTQEEIDARAAAAADAAELEQIKAVYLDVKNGNGTQMERLVRLEKVVARLMKEQWAPE